MNADAKHDLSITNDILEMTQNDDTAVVIPLHPAVIVAWRVWRLLSMECKTVKLDLAMASMKPMIVHVISATQTPYTSRN
jgi:hypothetical protein